MIRTTTFRLIFTLEDEADVTIQKKNGRIVSFGVNYRTNINGKWHDVIRYDTAHGAMHVHRFWISPGIIPIRDVGADIKSIIIEAVNDVKENWTAYKNFLTEKVKKSGK
jgi:hypothetical protein